MTDEDKIKQMLRSNTASGLGVQMANEFLGWNLFDCMLNLTNEFAEKELKAIDKCICKNRYECTDKGVKTIFHFELDNYYIEICYDKMDCGHGFIKFLQVNKNGNFWNNHLINFAKLTEPEQIKKTIQFIYEHIDKHHKNN